MTKEMQSILHKLNNKQSPLSPCWMDFKDIKAILPTWRSKSTSNRLRIRRRKLSHSVKNLASLDDKRVPEVQVQSDLLFDYREKVNIFGPFLCFHLKTASNDLGGRIQPHQVPIIWDQGTFHLKIRVTRARYNSIISPSHRVVEQQLLIPGFLPEFLETSGDQENLRFLEKVATTGN